MKKDSLYQQAKIARKNYRAAIARKNELEIQERKELIEAKKYASKISVANKNINIAASRVNETGEAYHNYCSFDTSDIVRSMAIFMSYVEGESFIPACTCDETQNSIIIRREAIEFGTDYLPIVLDDGYAIIMLDELISAYYNGDAILLDSGYADTVDLFDQVGTLNYSIGHYTYLHEFFNRLVLYRIENDIDESSCTMDTILDYMRDFLQMHPELAYMNKDKRDAMLSSAEKDYLAKLELKPNKKDE